MRKVRLAAILLCLVLSWASAEQVTVDFGSNAGMVTYRASGFIFGMSAADPVNSLLIPLKPRLIRGGETATGYAGSAFDVYDRLHESGTAVHIWPSIVGWPGASGNWCTSSA